MWASNLFNRAEPREMGPNSGGQGGAKYRTAGPAELAALWEVRGPPSHPVGGSPRDASA